MADNPRSERGDIMRGDAERAVRPEASGLGAAGGGMLSSDADVSVIIEGPAEPPSLMDRITSDRRITVAVIAALIVAALISAFPVRAHFTEPKTYEGVIQVLDEKKTNVMGLVAASTAASAGISLIPDDVGTPIANKLMDLSGNLMIILAVIYLEKYLLTIFGFATFGILFPVAFGLIALGIVCHRRIGLSAILRQIAAKAVALGMVIVLVVPVSVFVTKQIDATYDLTAEMVAAQEQAEDEAAAVEAEEQGDGSPLDFILSIPDMVADGVSSVTDDMLSQVNALIEQAAVMIVTSCLIPLLVLVFFLWAANLLLGINIDAPMGALAARAQRVKPSREDLALAKKRLAEHREKKRAPKAR